MTNVKALMTREVSMSKEGVGWAVGTAVIDRRYRRADRLSALHARYFLLSAESWS